MATQKPLLVLDDEFICFVIYSTLVEIIKIIKKHIDCGL